MLESKIRCHWNSDTQGDTTARPDLTCVSTLPVVMRQVRNPVWWSGLSARPDSSPCLGVWDVTLGVKSPTSHIMSLSPCPHGAAAPCCTLTARSDLPKSWAEHSGAWPTAVWDLLQFSLCHQPDWLWCPHVLAPVHPQFLSEPPLRPHLAVPWGWSIGFLPPSSSICCGPFLGHCPCLGWVSIKLSTDNLHQLNPSPPSELSGVRTHLACGEWELLSRLWGHWQPWPSLTWVPCHLMGSEFWLCCWSLLELSCGSAGLHPAQPQPRLRLPSLTWNLPCSMDLFGDSPAEVFEARLNWALSNLV